MCGGSLLAFNLPNESLMFHFPCLSCSV
uniref:Uncharacterized protein n=1 Tax=Arundo donax TaxID=35708 RepID=A0A0A9CBB1_ARUDO